MFVELLARSLHISDIKTETDFKKHTLLEENIYIMNILIQQSVYMVYIMLNAMFEKCLICQTIIVL